MSTHNFCKLFLLQILIFPQYIVFGDDLPHNVNLTVEWNDNWQNISAHWTNSTVLYSPQHGQDVVLDCMAPFPIQWSLTGFILPPEVVILRAPHRNLALNIYSITLAVYFEDAKNLENVGASLRVACEKIGNSEVAKDLFLFVRGYSNESLIQPEVSTIYDSRLLPCPTKDPNVTPQLYLKDSRDSEVTDPTIRYHPTEGFHSDGKLFNGVYICTQNGSSVTINAVVSNISQIADFQFTPKSDSVIRTFTENVLEFECLSKSGQPVILTVPEINEHLTVSYKNLTSLQISARRLAAGSDSSVASINGTVICTKNSTGEVLKQWHFEFVETPEFFLDSYSSEVHCLSQGNSRALQTVRCKNGMDCQFIGEHCLGDKNLCNFNELKHFHSDRESRCWLNKYKHGRSCISLPYYHWNGVGQCETNGLRKRWEYFVSLDLQKYSDWREAPKNELVRMDPVPNVIYTSNGTAVFFCTAVSYLFADSISFEIVYSNGTSELLQGNGNKIHISNPGADNRRKIEEFNVIGVLDLKLPLETVGINCLAPWWNGTDVMKTGVVFETRLKI